MVQLVHMVLFVKNSFIILIYWSYTNPVQPQIRHTMVRQYCPSSLLTIGFNVISTNMNRVTLLVVVHENGWTNNQCLHSLNLNTFYCLAMERQRIGQKELFTYERHIFKWRGCIRWFVVLLKIDTSRLIFSHLWLW